MRNPAVQLNALTRLFWRAHRYLYLVSRGHIGSRLFGWHVLLLKTTGRITSQPRIVALNALEDEGHYVVIASYAGAPRHPAWLLNLRAQPEAEILEGRKWIRVKAREAHGAERNRLWNKVIMRDLSYAEYQSRTNRKIPVVILEHSSPISGAADGHC